MFERFLTGTALIFFVYLLLFYTNTYIFYCILSLLFVYAFYEWLSMTDITNIRKILYLLFLTFSMLILYIYITPELLIFIFYLSIIFWIIILILLKNYKLLLNLMLRNYLSIGLFIFLTSWLCIISLNNLDNKLYFELSLSSDNLDSVTAYHFLFIIILISLSDISGYLIGKKFGRTKLIETISPNKTTEGFIASIVIPTAIFYIYFIVILSYPFFILDLVFVTLCCIFCTVGDLAVSSYKRAFSVKDSGNFLPGHGGLLDRLDSYLPTVFIYKFWMFL